MSTTSRDLSHTSPRLERLKCALACPTCGGDLDFEPDGGKCANCDAVFPVRNGRIYFVEGVRAQDAVDDFKGRFRRVLGNLYYGAATIITPVLIPSFQRMVRRRLDPSTKLVVDIGAGNRRLSDDVIALDFVDYDAVDVVCDLRALPFKPGSVDAFVSSGVLEHLPTPELVVRDLARCTRKSGEALHVIPFLFPYHASPHDYTRWTHKGAELLFSRFASVDVVALGGPVSLFLLGLAEFLSIIFSLGIPKLRGLAYVVACLLVFPFKLLDLPFIGRRAFISLSPLLRVHARDVTREE